MTGRVPILVASVVVLAGCRARDATITRGADSDAEWTRRLALAVPPGTSADSARAIMVRNQFLCREGADTVAYIWCDKRSPEGTSVVRRWQAVVNLDASRRVYESRGFTGLIGP